MLCRLLVTATALTLFGCSRAIPEPVKKPTFIRNPTVALLDKYIGEAVAIDGTPFLEKQGEVIDANGIRISVGTPMGIPYEFPSSGTVRVAGTLARFTNDYGETPYILDSATWVSVDSASP